MIKLPKYQSAPSFYSSQKNLFTHSNQNFSFKTFPNFSKTMSQAALIGRLKGTRGGTGRLTFFFAVVSATARCQHCASVALISIYECNPDAAFKVPSTQHLATASLYRTGPSPRSPVLKQSIIKEKLSAITLSDSNGISSGRHIVHHAPRLHHKLIDDEIKQTKWRRESSMKVLQCF